MFYLAIVARLNASSYIVYASNKDSIAQIAASVMIARIKSNIKTREQKQLVQSYNETQMHLKLK